MRTEKGRRQRLVLNLGDLQIEKSRWPALAAARRIVARRAEQINATEAEQFESVDVGSFEASQPRSLGPEYVCHAMWNDLGFNEETLSYIETRLAAWDSHPLGTVQLAHRRITVTMGIA